MFAMGPAFFKQTTASYAALALTGTFADATVGSPYSSSIPISGGLEPYSLTGGTGVVSGSLDSGFSLSITGSTGARFLTLSCASPATADTMTFTASVDSSDAQTATSAQSVLVSANAIDAWFNGGGSGLWLDAAQGTWRDAAGTTAAVAGDPVRLWGHRRGARDVASSADSTSAVLRWDATLSRYYLEFTAASLQQYIVNSGVKGDWKALHDGSEFVIVAKVSVGTSTNPNALLPVLSTAAISGTTSGLNIFYDDRSAASMNNAFRVFISNGSGTPREAVTQNSFAPQVVHAATGCNNNDGSPAPDIFAYIDGSAAGSASVTSYSTTDPQDMLTIGGSHTSFYADMKLYALAVIVGPGAVANRAAYEAAI